MGADQGLRGHAQPIAAQSGAPAPTRSWIMYACSSSVPGRLAHASALMSLTRFRGSAPAIRPRHARATVVCVEDADALLRQLLSLIGDRDILSETRRGARGIKVSLSRRSDRGTVAPHDHDVAFGTSNEDFITQVQSMIDTIVAERHPISRRVDPEAAAEARVAQALEGDVEAAQVGAMETAINLAWWLGTWPLGFACAVWLWPIGIMVGAVAWVCTVHDTVLHVMRRAVGR